MISRTSRARPISRRGFLKTGCLTVAAMSLTVCGIGTAIPAPDPDTPELPSLTYGEDKMKNRILVTYASAFGSTAEVSAEIGKTLAASGCSVDVRPMQEVAHIGATGSKEYQAVLIGSAVQHGKWLPEAEEFVRANRPALNRMPVVLFCVHICNTGSDAKSRKNRLAYLDAVRPLLNPAAEGFFGGRFDRRGAAQMLPGWIARFIPTTDLRNWKKIRAWAESIRPLLQPA